MRAVDTNVLVRLVIRDDSRHVAAAEAFIERGAWVSTLVLTEATWVLENVYELTPGDQADAVEMLLNHRHPWWFRMWNGSNCAGVIPFQNRPSDFPTA